LPALTIVEDYIRAALPRVKFRVLPEGGVEAWIPECGGVIASGDATRECVDDLIDRLQEWIAVGIENGFHIAVLDGVDLNTSENRALAGYHKHPPRAQSGEFYANTEELNAAFERHMRTD